MTMCTATPALAPVSPAFDRDAATAAQLQRMLLPPSPFAANGWVAEHHFVPAERISGDFVDLVPFRDRIYFMLGDASGKGAAASLVMAQLHAMFRTLIPFELSGEEYGADRPRKMNEYLFEDRLISSFERLAAQEGFRGCPDAV
jgi:sigma-B regulation protein RsbU (phosphoserine phosphatase)